jgi:hypothetical protein
MVEKHPSDREEKETVVDSETVSGRKLPAGKEI